MLRELMTTIAVWGSGHDRLAGSDEVDDWTPFVDDSSDCAPSLASTVAMEEEAEETSDTQ
jgi:hypothetical protein